MEIYRVTFIGHRDIDRIGIVEKRLERLVSELLRKKDYVEFYMGRNGDFDETAASVIKRLQKKLDTRNSAVILVLSYHAKDEEYYQKYYDDVLLPIASDTHFKAAITKRNEWMVEHADLLIAYVCKESGGAYKTMKYAEKKGVGIINLSAMDIDD